MVCTLTDRLGDGEPEAAYGRDAHGVEELVEVSSDEIERFRKTIELRARDNRGSDSAGPIERA
jgi:hypothetical protein